MAPERKNRPSHPLLDSSVTLVGHKLLTPCLVLMGLLELLDAIAKCASARAGDSRRRAAGQQWPQPQHHSRDVLREQYDGDRRWPLHGRRLSRYHTGAFWDWKSPKVRGRAMA